MHLRMCQSCGQIGCCDSSPNQHASRHARATGHAIARSAEPGEELELVLRRRGRVRDRGTLMLPELHLAEWRATKDTLHLYCQVLGKVRLATTAPRNHWWNVPLYVDVRGLTTRRLHHRGTTFDITLDFVDHALVVRTADGRGEGFELHDGLDVAEFDRRLHAALGGARDRRRHPRGAVRRADDDAVSLRSRARRVGSRVRGALLGGARLDRPRARGVQRLVQRQDEPGPPVLAQPRSRRHALLRTRRPAGRGRPRSPRRPTRAS